ncbi:MAG: hypothetical protein IPJ58_07310 [Ardenticatenia bacterium]|nr:hypothetical protein [Ardenticatenia bacterium]
MGNEQLVALSEARDEVAGWMGEWRARGELLQKRLPRWQALEQLAVQARDLEVMAELAPQLEALRVHRTLLSDPDPVAPLLGTLTQALRQALQSARDGYVASHEREMERLGANATWSRLTLDQRAGILAQWGIGALPAIHVGTEQELAASLAAVSLDSWATRRDALPQRFAQALDEAAKLLEPKSVRVTLPTATIRDEEELRAWLDGAERMIREQLGVGPVIL